MKNLPHIIAWALAAVLFAAPAVAKNNGNHGNGHGNSNGHRQSEWSSGDEDHGNGKGKSHHSRQDDRNVLRKYVLAKYKKNCPPGLAKKNPPCIPPGQSKKYKIGSHLQEGEYQSLPNYIIEQLTPAPDYGRYVRVDQNVYLITEGTRKVLEAIELFSAVK